MNDRVAAGECSFNTGRLPKIAFQQTQLLVLLDRIEYVLALEEEIQNRHAITCSEQLWHQYGADIACAAGHQAHC